MLVIRMQRTGRKGHAQFRVVVQDSRRTPTSGKLVASLGHFNPHTKETSLDKEKASFYLEHGAQPSERVVRLLKSEGVKLPKWVEVPDNKSGKTKNIEKRRSTRPDEPKAPETVTSAEIASEETVVKAETSSGSEAAPEKATEAIEPESETSPLIEATENALATDEPEAPTADSQDAQTEPSESKSEENSEKSKEA